MKAQILGISMMIALFGISTTTFAQDKFDATHPRRAEVNSRLAHQDARITTKHAKAKSAAVKQHVCIAKTIAFVARNNVWLPSIMAT